MTNATFFTTIPSPVGRLTLLGEGTELIGLYFEGDPHGERAGRGALRDDGRLLKAVQQLKEYFAGQRTRFELSLAPRGTAFRKSVWQALSKIPYGQTSTYGEIARAIGKPAASRAVGGANHNNPIAIIIPCHRVVGADGSMTGYGGGLGRKQQLLALEARVARPLARAG